MFKNGVRHEFSKRYTFFDWEKNSIIRKLIDQENCDELIYKEIEKGTPLLIGRLGGTEARFIGAYMKTFPEFNRNALFRSRKLNNFEKRKKEVQVNAGFFYSDNSEAQQFVRNYIDCLKNTDILGGWGDAFTWPETYALANPMLKVINKEFTAPWVETYESKKPNQSKTPWSNVLEGKKVLIISPFAATILSQHNVIKKVFPTVYYPQFSLQTIKAPLTSGILNPTSNTWLEFLNEIKMKIALSNFDIALISCGSYSYPLAHYVKNLGKIGVHCGGALQLYFGIMGNRWKTSSHITKFQNSNWVRPSAEETPAGANLIEGACYW
jgi:hypothetical protein